MVLISAKMALITAYKRQQSVVKSGSGVYKRHMATMAPISVIWRHLPLISVHIS
jgi:hypothetical protein